MTTLPVAHLLPPPAVNILRFAALGALPPLTSRADMVDMAERYVKTAYPAYFKQEPLQ